MSIRKLFLLVSIGFIFIAFLTTASLLHLTTSMHKLSQSSKQQMDSVRASEELQVSLLQFSRESLRYLRLGRDIPPEDRLKHEHEIRSRLDDVKAAVDSPEETLLLAEIRDSTEAYLRAHDNISPKAIRNLDPIPEVPSMLDKAIALSEKFTTLNTSQSDDLQIEIAKEDKRANVLAATLSAMFLVTFLLSLFALRKIVVQPISNLSNELELLSNNKKMQLIHEEGPAEIRSIALAFNKLASEILNQRETALRFLAGVAHDLRNPLGAIRMSSQILADEDSSPEERQGIVQIISRQAQQLDRMVGDLLDTTRIESGQLDMKRSKVQLSQLVEDAVNLHRSVTQLHSFDLSVSDGAIAEVDPVRISQVLNNLLSNAIKYSPNGGEITVKLAKQSGRAIIEVTDCGIGIAPEDQKTIFEPFRRTKTTKLTIPGVGLGLSVAKKIIEAHSGSIEVLSQPGIGTTFLVSLPIVAKTHATLRTEYEPAL